MTRYQDIWVQIESDPLVRGSVVRRVLPKLKHDVFLGQHRPSGERFAEMQLIATAVGRVPSPVARTRGLEVRVVLRSADSAVIRLSETTDTHGRQFEELVSDVLTVLEAAPGEGAAARVVSRIVAWQEFFAREGAPLSAGSAAGLFAELTLLNTVVAPAVGVERAVDHWTGPDPALQDFQFPAGSIEVKSYRGTGTGALEISSERQLDRAGTDHLFVAYVELDQRSNGTGETLADVIGTSKRLAGHSTPAAALLGDKLRTARWTESHAEVRTERYAVRRLEFFEVLDDFPRLTPEVLPVGLGNVRYRIDRSSLEAFLSTADHLRHVLELHDD